MTRYVPTATVWAFAVLLALSAQTTAGDQDRKVSKDYVKNLYMNYLKEEGYQGEVKDDLIFFKHDGGTFVLEIQNDDPTYFRIVKPGIWSIDSEDERLIVLQAASMACGDIKIAKTYVVKDNTWVSAETHVPNYEGFAAAFKRLLSAIDAGEKKFVFHMKALNEKKA